MLQPIIDNFLEPVAEIPLAARFTGLFQGVITLLCIYLVAVCASYLQTRLMLTVTQRSINDLRRELFDHLQDLSVRYYDTHTHGEMMSRFSNDVDTLNDALANSLTSLFSSVIALRGHPRAHALQEHSAHHPDAAHDPADVLRPRAGS